MHAAARPQETCCPSGNAMETGGRVCGLDTPDAADDQCSYHCGAPYLEFLENCQGTLDQLGAANFELS